MASGHVKRRLRRLIQIVSPGILALAGYRPSWLANDLAAGLSVAAIALPVGIAYSDLAGVPPVIGMYSVSQPILTGYLNGIALIIVVGQVPKLLGYPASEEQFLPKILEFFQRVDQSHWPTAALGAGTLVFLVLIIRFLPRLPGAFVVVGISILLVLGLGLEQQGVAVLGDVPGGLPSIVLPSFQPEVFNDIFGAAAGLVLVSFTSGVLTAKSFARRNGYEVNANQELIGFGACNLASGLAQGFPVTGADSRTAVNNAMGGKTQMVGLVAGGAMLLVLMYQTAPLAHVPTTALAAVILVAAIGLFDVVDLRLFDNIDHELLLKALRHHCKIQWVLMYVTRWLTAPMQTGDQVAGLRPVGLSQGGPLSPILSNLFLHYALDHWLSKYHSSIPFCRYADDGILHCRSEAEATEILCALKQRLDQCGLELHPDKTRIVYCTDCDRTGTYENVQFDFLGYSFRPRRFIDRQDRVKATFTPAVSRQAMTEILQSLRRRRLQLHSELSLDDLARTLNPRISGWINYYCRFRGSEFQPVADHIDRIIVRWAMRKFKRLRGHKTRAYLWLDRVRSKNPSLFIHWTGRGSFAVGAMGAR